MTSTPRSSHWEHARLFVDGEALFARMLDAIRGARERVDFEFYIFELDAVGHRFVEALGDAAARGVAVHVMVDGVGSMEDLERLMPALITRGVQVRVYHPLPWFFTSYRWSRRGGLVLLKFLRLLWNVNRRNHRKLCAVDARVAWVGSFNVSAVHLPSAAGGQGWRDYAVELEGPRVATLVEGFEDLWNGHRSRLRRGFLAGYLSNRSLRARQLKNRFVTRSVINSRRVWLVSAYFLPTAALRRSLLQACRAGADVRLLLPERSDVVVFPGLSSHYYHELLRAGARIFLYQPGVLHAKALLLDEKLIIGSSNWNYRSSLHDLELDVVVRDSVTLANMEDVMREDAASSREILLHDTPAPGLLSWLLYAMRYWM